MYILLPLNDKRLSAFFYLMDTRKHLTVHSNFINKSTKKKTFDGHMQSINKRCL